MHLYNAKKEYSSLFQASPCSQLPPVLFSSGQTDAGNGNTSLFKTFLASHQRLRRYLLQTPPAPRSLTKVVLELPSLCLTRGRDEEWKALPSFPPQDKEKSQNIPDDWIVFDSPPPTDGLGVRMGMKGETPGVAHGTVAGSDHLFINPKRRIWPKLKAASWWISL